MDFLDPKKKRSHKIRLYIGYALVSVAILLGAVILLYAAYGYSIDRKGHVFQNGLVFLASKPDAAQVNIKNASGEELPSVVTDERIALPEGSYNFEFLKEGYRPWSHSLDLKGGAIKRFAYPFLFPEAVNTEDVLTYSQKPGLITQSPGRNTILSQDQKDFYSFNVLRTDQETNQTTGIKFPSSIFGKTSGSNELKLIEWSTDNRHILVKHNFGAKSEFLMLDIEEPERSYNLKDEFKNLPDKVVLRDKSANLLYAQFGKRLVEYDVRSDKSETILRNVVDFQPHGRDDMVYVNAAKSGKKTSDVFVKDRKDSYKLRELPAGKKYLLDLAKYDGRWYVSVGAKGQDEVFVYRDPVQVLAAKNDNSTIATRTLRIDNTRSISFSANAQFIAAQGGKNGQGFAVYDAYEDTQHRYTLDKTLAKNAAPAKWMDGHRLLSYSDGKVVVFDFDGTNSLTFAPAATNMPIMFDGAYNSMFVVNKNKTSYKLQRVSLVAVTQQ